MYAITCAQVREWVEQAVGGAAIKPLPPELLNHVVGCAVCRGAMALLIAHVHVSSAPSPVSCDQCRDELAAFIDAEATDVLQALRDYPHIWWHVSTCAACAEQYNLTRALLAADQQGTFVSDRPVPVLPVPRAQPLRLINLPRQYLNIALPLPSPQLGVMRGRAATEPTVIAEETTTTGVGITVSVQEQLDDAWTVIVDSAPPLTDRLILMLGPYTFEASFNERGTAVVENVPSAILAATNGPELLIATRST